jgi:tRNA A-37 threonylcarbamoyl transferase component Bud32
MVQLGEALINMHKKNYTHGALNPSMIMVTYKGAPLPTPTSKIYSAKWIP